jgi:uncharacterized membrane protein YhhN
MTIVNLLFLLFCVLGAAHILGELLLIKGVKRGMIIRYITKPFIMPLLAVYYVAAAREVNWWLFAGIIGGFGGDFFLMLPDPEKTRKWFRMGLVSFLAGHIFYIVAFIQAAKGFHNFAWWSVLLAIPYVLFGAIVSPRLIRHTGKMRIPVTIYIFVIVVMGVCATFLWGTGRAEGIMILMIGALIFMISDAINAFNKFAHEIPNERIYTMSTYIIGQFLIVYGYVLAL